MTDAAAKKVESRFDNLAQEFWELKSVMNSAEQSIETGAGSLFSLLSANVADLALGWRETFDVSSTSARHRLR